MGAITRALGTATVLFTMLVTTPALVGQTPGQTSGEKPGEKPDETKLAVVGADNVLVRAGAADSYYPFGKLRRGDVVKVIGEKHNWVRVQTTGPAFDGFFAYVRYPKSDSGGFRLAEDGKTATTLGITRVLAPNMNTHYEPNDSWKRIHLLPANASVTVLETRQTERTIVHKIAIPAGAEGWISASFLQPAGPDAVAKWTTAMTPGAAAKAIVEKTPTPETILAQPETTLDPVEPPVETTLTAAPTTDEMTTGTTTGTTDDLPIVATPEEPPATPPMGLVPTDDALTTSDAIADETLAGVLAEEFEMTIAEATPTETTERLLVPPPPPLTPVERFRLQAIEQPAEETLSHLEFAYTLLQDEPIETAEVQPLRQLYLTLAKVQVENGTVARYATARAEQLAIWTDLQTRRVELSRLRKRVELTSEEAAAMRLVMDTSGRYVAVGRLGASTVYDGTRLPRLYRITDPANGRTIAYLRPDNAFDMTAMLGRLVGVMGRMVSPGDLRVTLIEPARIDLLAETTANARR